MTHNPLADSPTYDFLTYWGWLNFWGTTLYLPLRNVCNANSPKKRFVCSIRANVKYSGIYILHKLM